ncbi:MAG: DUF1573 domain-containing protein [Cyclobacteriaceae bacterium]
MMKTVLSILVGGLLVFLSFECSSQGVEENVLKWENNQLNLGAVMEENGEVTVDYYFENKEDFPVIIDEVVTDCGCTTIEYSKDTLFKDEKGLVKVKFDPQYRGGTFSKMILVKTNIDTTGDSLFLEGVNIPYPEDVEQHYKIRKGGLGFVFPVNNLGTIFSNKTKIKYLDFYNFSENPIQLNQIQPGLSEHLHVKMTPPVVPSEERGVLEIGFDPTIKKELGFIEEEISLSVLSLERFDVSLQFVATLHEHFEPVPISKIDSVPRLELEEPEVDLGKISSRTKVNKRLTLENVGGEILNIRKIVTNCNCLTFDLPKYDLQMGESIDLTMEFDPEGRRGIDHKTLTIFSNDPLNPTRTILIKSRID